MQLPQLLKFISISSSFKTGLQVKTETHKLLLSHSLIVSCILSSETYFLTGKNKYLFLHTVSTDFGGQLMECGSLSGLKYRF